MGPLTLPVHLASLTAMPGGIDQSQYVGTEVSWKNLTLRYSVQAAWDNTNYYPSPFTIRCLVVWIDDWHQRTTAYSIDRFLHNNNNPPTDVLEHYTWATRDTFKVLHDEIYATSDKRSSTSHIGGEFNISLKGLKTQYSSNAPYNNDTIVRGACWVYFLSDCPTGGNWALPQLDLITMMYYTDA